jgi:hypothetical protein
MRVGVDQQQNNKTKIEGKQTVKNRKVFSLYLTGAIAAAGFLCHAPVASAQLSAYSPRHYHPAERLEVLARLRYGVNEAINHNDPRGAIQGLLQITRIEPHDYYAWEKLSESYARLGDAASAANVDLDTVSYFEFIPDAAPQVQRAMNRLQNWAPNDWQHRVENIRANRLPYIPTEACDAVIEVVRPSLPVETRRKVYTRIEETFSRREDRVTFINKWKGGARNASMTREEIQSHSTFKAVYQVITEIE